MALFALGDVVRQREGEPRELVLGGGRRGAVAERLLVRQVAKRTTPFADLVRVFGDATHESLVVRRLVATSDVVVANLPPQTLQAMGLDYATLCESKADIILLPSDGPYSI